MFGDVREEFRGELQSTIGMQSILLLTRTLGYACYHQLIFSLLIICLVPLLRLNHSHKSPSIQKYINLHIDVFSHSLHSYFSVKNFKELTYSR